MERLARQGTRCQEKTSAPHAQRAKPREFAGIVSGQPNGFNAFIRANEGKVVQLSLFFDKVPELGKERKGDVYPPNGYRGEELTPFFNVKEGSYWIRNAPGGRKTHRPTGQHRHRRLLPRRGDGGRLRSDYPSPEPGFTPAPDVMTIGKDRKPA